MGQYVKAVNFTKREFIDAHKIGLGLKFLEQLGEGGTGDILMALLASSMGRGGGDINSEVSDIIGRWAGDQVAIIGDYSEPDDIPGVDAKMVYQQCKEEYTEEDAYTDISDLLVPFINEQWDTQINVAEDGWRRR